MSEKAFEFVKREDLAPICPHCEKELNVVYTRAKGVPLIQGTNVVYFCPHCNKVLGFGQGRMI
jgi:phage FluMu protein Com